MNKKCLIITLCILPLISYGENNRQDTHHDVQQPSSVSPTQESYQQINNIIFSSEFSNQQQTTSWERKKPKAQEVQQNNRFLEALAEIISDILNTIFGSAVRNFDVVNFLAIMIKTILLLLLLAFFIWLYKKRQIWQAWFRKLNKQLSRTTIVTVTTHTPQPLPTMWQDLPDKAHLANFIRQLLHQQQWLKALSVLYRGTLREMIMVHGLSITKASTEQQCLWLLKQSATASVQEAQFFQGLVEIWSQTAYGKRQPSTLELSEFFRQINQLIEMWERLYMPVQREAS